MGIPCISAIFDSLSYKQTMIFEGVILVIVDGDNIIRKGFVNDIVYNETLSMVEKFHRCALAFLNRLTTCMYKIYNNLRANEMGAKKIYLVFMFDGSPPAMKIPTQTKRRQREAKSKRPIFNPIMFSKYKDYCELQLKQFSLPIIEKIFISRLQVGETEFEAFFHNTQVPKVIVTSDSDVIPITYKTYVDIPFYFYNLQNDIIWNMRTTECPLGRDTLKLLLIASGCDFIQSLLPCSLLKFFFGVLRQSLDYEQLDSRLGAALKKLTSDLTIETVEAVEDCLLEFLKFCSIMLKIISQNSNCLPKSMLSASTTNGKHLRWLHTEKNWTNKVQANRTVSLKLLYIVVYFNSGVKSEYFHENPSGSFDSSTYIYYLLMERHRCIRKPINCTNVLSLLKNSF